MCRRVVKVDQCFLQPLPKAGGCEGNFASEISKEKTVSAYFNIISLKRRSKIKQNTLNRSLKNNDLQIRNFIISDSDILNQKIYISVKFLTEMDTSIHNF